MFYKKEIISRQPHFLYDNDIFLHSKNIKLEYRSVERFTRIM